MNRKLIDAALRERFIPALRSRAFKGPFPHFRRALTDRIDLLTVQFDKWGGGFVIEIGRCPPNGVKTAWGKEIAPEKVTAHDLHPSARHRIGSSAPGEEGKWFRYDGGTSPVAVAEAAVSALKEADDWWGAG
jgi:hypothetical protein